MESAPCSAFPTRELRPRLHTEPLAHGACKRPQDKKVRPSIVRREAIEILERNNGAETLCTTALRVDEPLVLHLDVAGIFGNIVQRDQVLVDKLLLL